MFLQFFCLPTSEIGPNQLQGRSPDHDSFIWSLRLYYPTMDVDHPYAIHNIAVLEGMGYFFNARLSVGDSTITGHDERAWHIAWNPTKPLLASCSADKSVRLYNYTSSNSLESPDLKFSHIATIPTGHSKTVRALAWAPSGKTLATASFDSNIGIWEQESSSDDDGDGDGHGHPSGEWECASLLEGHETECKSVAYSSSGTLLASCSRDKTVWIWEGV